MFCLYWNLNLSQWHKMKQRKQQMRQRFGREEPVAELVISCDVMFCGHLESTENEWLTAMILLFEILSTYNGIYQETVLVCM